MFKQFRRSLAMILAVLMVIGMVPALAYAADGITVSSISGVKVIAEENGTLRLTASSDDVTWMSSNSQIASVDAQGEVTARDKNGTVLITAISKSDASVRGYFTLDVAIPGNFYNVQTYDESLYSYTSSSSTNYVKNPAITFSGSWGIYGGEQFKHIGGAKTSTSTVDNYFEMTFNGTGVQVIAQKTKLMSAYRITLDGQDMGVYSLYSTAANGLSQQVIFEATDLENTSHTIRGTIVEQDGRCEVNLDAINVLTPAYDVYVADNNINSSTTNNPQITLSGNWRGYAYTGEPEKHLGGSKTDGVADGSSYVEYTFTGIGIELIAQKTKFQGAYQVFIDGKDMGTYSMYSENGEAQASVFKKIGLEYGEHTIRCVAVTEDGRNEINFDAFKVYTPVASTEIIENVTPAGRTNPDIKMTGFVGIWGAPSELRGEGASVEYTFDGTGIEVYAMKQIYQEAFNVYIDGTLMGKFSLYPASGNTEHGALIFAKNDLANKTHTLKLVAVIDDETPKTSGIETNFDYFKVSKPEHSFEKVDTIDAVKNGTLSVSNASSANEWANGSAYNGTQYELRGGTDMTVEFNFVGTGIAVHGMRQIYQDAARIYIDGEDCGLYTFYPQIGTSGSDTVFGALVFEKKDLDFGSHTIKLVASPDAGMSASRDGQNQVYAITVDYFRVYNDRTVQFIDDRNLDSFERVINPDFISSGYTPYHNDYIYGAYHYNQSKSEATSTTANIEYTFYGEGVEIIVAKNHTQHALATVIDGENIGNIDEYAPSLTTRAPLYMKALELGAHTISLTNTYSSKASYDSVNTNIDGFRVYLPYNYNMTDLDKSALIDVIEDAISIDTSNFSTENIETLNAAISDATAVANNLYTSQQKVDNAKAALEDVVSYIEQTANGWYISGDTLTVYENLGDFTSKNTPWAEYANSVKKLVVAEGVTEIGAWAFGYFYNLKEVELPQTLTTIGTNAFYRAEKLESVTIPESVNTIKSGAFSYCYALKEVSIPVAVTTIESYTFYDCKKLISAYYAGTEEQWNAVNIKKGNENIKGAYPPVAEEIFDWKVENGTLIISGNVAMPDYASKTAPWYSQAGEIKAIVIEDGIKSIGKYAFAYLDKAASVQIADSVKSIAPYAFYGAGIKEVSIPESVTSLGNGAFTYCRSLAKVEIPASVKKIQNYTFFGCNKLETVTYAGDFSALVINTGNDPLINAAF